VTLSFRTEGLGRLLMFLLNIHFHWKKSQFLLLITY